MAELGAEPAEKRSMTRIRRPHPGRAARRLRTFVYQFLRPGHELTYWLEEGAMRMGSQRVRDG